MRTQLTLATLRRGGGGGYEAIRPKKPVKYKKTAKFCYDFEKSNELFSQPMSLLC